MSTDTQLVRLTDEVLDGLDENARSLVEEVRAVQGPEVPPVPHVFYSGRHRTTEDLDTRRLDWPAVQAALDPPPAVSSGPEPTTVLDPEQVLAGLNEAAGLPRRVPGDALGQATFPHKLPSVWQMLSEAINPWRKRGLL